MMSFFNSPVSTGAVLSAAAFQTSPAACKAPRMIWRESCAGIRSSACPSSRSPVTSTVIESAICSLSQPRGSIASPSPNFEEVIVSDADGANQLPAAIATTQTQQQNWAREVTLSDLIMFQFKFVFALVVVALIIGIPICVVWGAIEKANDNARAAVTQELDVKEKNAAVAYYQELSGSCRGQNRESCRI